MFKVKVGVRAGVPTVANVRMVHVHGWEAHRLAARARRPQEPRVDVGGGGVPVRVHRDLRAHRIAPEGRVPIVTAVAHERPGTVQGEAHAREWQPCLGPRLLAWRSSPVWRTA